MSILHVDDHALTRGAYQLLIQQSLPQETLLEASDSHEVIRILTKDTTVQLVILDINLSGLNGIELAEKIKSRWPHVKVLFCSFYEDITIIKRCIQIGGLGYVSKSSHPEEFVKAIVQVLKGHHYLQHEIAIKLVNFESNPVNKHPIDLLTSREYNIYLQTAKGATRHHIASNLNVSPKTISNNITQIKQKLGLKSNCDFVLSAQQFQL